MEFVYLPFLLTFFITPQVKQKKIIMYNKLLKQLRFRILRNQEILAKCRN